MECPNCSSHLATLELVDIELDYCFSCRGIWLDRGETERLIRIAGGKDIILKSPASIRSGERTRKCPVCRKSMEKVRTGKPGHILIDRCRAHGIWTDAGELNRMLELSCSEHQAASPIIRLLDSMFSAQKGECV